MIQVLRESTVDRALGVGRKSSAEFRPFLEVLCSVERNDKMLRERIRRWPTGM